MSRRVIVTRDSVLSKISDETVSDESEQSDKQDGLESDTDADSSDESLSSGTQSFISAAIAFSSRHCQHKLIASLEEKKPVWDGRATIGNQNTESPDILTKKGISVEETSIQEN